MLVAISEEVKGRIKEVLRQRLSCHLSPVTLQDITSEQKKEGRKEKQSPFSWLFPVYQIYKYKRVDLALRHVID